MLPPVFAVRKLILLALMVLTLFACGPSRYEPVRNVYRSPTPVTQGFHTVKAGETLYSIAWRYNRNHHELAQNNGISAPYNIYPGQQISLTKPVSKNTNSTNKTTSAKSPKQTTRYKKSKSHTKPVQEKLANQRHKKVGWLATETQDCGQSRGLPRSAPRRRFEKRRVAEVQRPPVLFCHG